MIDLLVEWVSGWVILGSWCVGWCVDAGAVGFVGDGSGRGLGQRLRVRILGGGHAAARSQSQAAAPGGGPRAVPSHAVRHVDGAAQGAGAPAILVLRHVVER